MGHQLAQESMQDAMTWLALVLAGERPTEPVPDFDAVGCRWGPEAASGGRGSAAGGAPGGGAGRLLLLGQ